VQRENVKSERRELSLINGYYNELIFLREGKVTNELERKKAVKGSRPTINKVVVTLTKVGKKLGSVKWENS